MDGLLALLTLALLIPLSIQAQPTTTPIFFPTSMAVQDDSTSMQVDGTFNVFIADTLFLRSSSRPIQLDEQEVEIELASLNLTTMSLPPVTFNKGGPLSTSMEGRLKEASVAMEGGCISVQRCSTEDGPLTVSPLTVSPLRIDFSGETPETALVTIEYVILATFAGLDGQCYIDDNEASSLCFEAH